MLNQERQRLSAIIKSLEEAEGLTMSQFVRVMLRILSSPRKTASTVEVDSREYFQLIYGLQQMFEEIDINGDGTMEWTELMQFLLDTVNQRNQMTFDIKKIEEIQNENEEQPTDSNYYSVVSKISGATEFSVLSDFSEVAQAKENLGKKFLNDNFTRYQRSKFSVFRESETLFDKTKRKSHILKAVYSPKFQKYIICNEDKAKSFVIARETQASEGAKKSMGVRDMANHLEDEMQINLDFKKPSHILSMAWSERHQMLGLLGTDGRIFFYRSKSSTFMLMPLFVIDASELAMQTHIWYLASHDVWLTCGKDFVLREWALSQATLAETQGGQESGRLSLDQIRAKISLPHKKGNHLQSGSANANRMEKYSQFRKKTLNA